MPYLNLKKIRHRATKKLFFENHDNPTILLLCLACLRDLTACHINCLVHNKPRQICAQEPHNTSWHKAQKSVYSLEFEILD